MDKQTESREQFEAWFKNHFKFHEMLNGDRSIALSAWQASRESLVVELPKSGFYLGYGCPEYMEKDDVIDALRAIGIRIKGEGV